jgi:hypothetical protein
LKLSTNAFWVGFPGAMQCHSNCRSYDQRGIEVEVNSVLLSLTTARGLPQSAMIASSYRPIFAPDSDVSATSARHSGVKSSTTHKIRNRRPQLYASDTKSSDQRWFGPCGSTIGAQCPFPAAKAAHLEPFLAIEPQQLLVVRRQALAGQQAAQAPIPEPPTLAQPVTLPGMGDRVPPRAARRHALSRCPSAPRCPASPPPAASRAWRCSSATRPHPPAFEAAWPRSPQARQTLPSTCRRSPR